MHVKIGCHLAEETGAYNLFGGLGYSKIRMIVK